MENLRKKRRAALFSILSNFGIILLKLGVGLAIQSISVLSEAIHSAIDLISAVIAYLSVGKSSEPADSIHPFGHGKFESLSGLVEASLVAVAGIFIILEAVDRIQHPRPLPLISWGIGVMAISALATLAVYRHNIKVAHDTESLALEANAFHLSADVYTSLGVLAGLVLIPITGMDALDPIAALAVAAFILHASVGLMKKAARDLMDTKLPEAEEKEIRTLLQDHYSQFVEFHKLRTRKAGADRYIELHLVLSKQVNLERAHELSKHLEEEIRSRFAKAQTIIHLEPCEASCPVCAADCHGEKEKLRS